MPSTKRPMTVLLVDDDTSNRELYRLAFALQGHCVATAASGWDAVHLFATIKPDAVLVDLILGDMVGTEAIARMREFSDADFYLFSDADRPVLELAAKKR